MTKQDTLANLIVDTALEISDGESWSALTLAKIADQLNLPLTDIYRCYPDLDNIANAWIRRADFSMADGASSAVEDNLETDERLHVAIMCWLSALEGRRHTMRDILFYKLKPPHFHLQAQFVVATSQRIQMLREVTRLSATGMVKTVEEIGLTILFSSTVLVWLNDSSENSRRTSDYLKKQLKFGGRIVSKIH